MSERVGVVLAAGTGWRLVKGDPARPLKPLTKVGGVPLLQRTIRGLSLAGCGRVVVVVGHGAAAIEEFLASSAASLPVPVEVAHNARWQLKNGVSVLAAAQACADAGEIVLAMADHVVGDEIWQLAAAHRPPVDGATLLVDRRIAEVLDLDDATKVQTSADRIVRIGKTLADYDAIDVGVFVATPALFVALRTVLAREGDASLSEGVQELAAGGRMTVLDVGAGFWQDVDDERMLVHAEAKLAAQTRGREAR